jgi:hypothetical protein
MPRHLRAACLLYVASRVTMATLAPFYEASTARITSPVLMALFIAVAILFMRRVAWTWKVMQYMTLTEAALNAVFFPTQKFFGAYTDLAHALAAVIIMSSAMVFWSMLRVPETKAWFWRSRAHADAP